MDWHECVHPVVASPLLEMPSAENITADCPLANHVHVVQVSPSVLSTSAPFWSSHEATPTYILLFTDRFSRRADMFPVTAAEFTTEGIADNLANQDIPLWGCPRTILSDNGLQFCSKLSQAVYQLLGVCKLATSSYHPNCNGGVERVNNTMAPMLAMAVNERQVDWDLHMPHVEFAYNNSVSAAMGLAPNGVHMGRLPRLPLTVFDRAGVVGHQSLARDHLAHCDLTTDRQKRANDIVRAHRARTVSRVNRRNSALADALRPAPNFATGGWAWVYNSASTIRQVMKANTDAKVLKAKLALNWTGPYKILKVGSCSGATSSIWISLSTCPVRTLVGVWPSSAANSAPTPTTAGTCPNTYRRG